MSEQADIIVIGMGVGGEEVAERLAEAGLDVIGVEARFVGGECPYWGCVPSKMMIRAANLLAEARRIPNMAGTATVSPDWAPVAASIREEATDDWDDRVAVERCEGKGGRFLRGRARITAPRAVEVDGHVVTARRGIVIATGTEPAVPPVPGLADVAYWTNREAIERQRRFPLRSSCWAPARSGPSWPRFLPASARWSPSSRLSSGSCLWKNPRPARSSPKCSPAMASSSISACAPSGSAKRASRSPSPSTMETASPPTGSSSQPGGASTSPASG